MDEMRVFCQDFGQSIQSGETTLQLSADVIPAGKKENAQSALEIYQNAYTVRLTEALGQCFESVWWVLGDEDFFSTCREYIDKYPSQVYNINRFGDCFSEFLAGHEISFLKDLARFEWSFQEVFHAARARQPRGLPTKIRLSARTRSIRSEYAIYEVWQQRKSIVEDSPNIQIKSPQCLTIFKNFDGRIEVKKISMQEFDFLERLGSGENLEEACTSMNWTIEQVEQFFKKNALLFL